MQTATRKKQNIFKYTVRGEQGKLLFNTLYSGSNIHLHRKYNFIKYIN